MVSLDVIGFQWKHVVQTHYFMLKEVQFGSRKCLGVDQALGVGLNVNRIHTFMVGLRYVGVIWLFFLIGHLCLIVVCGLARIKEKTP